MTIIPHFYHSKFIISCPHCGGPTRKHYHDPQGPRRVFGFESDFWAMGIQYQCLGQGTADSKCSNRRNTRGQKTYYFFDTLDRAYLDTLPESIVLRLPLVLLSSFTLVQREFMNMISKAGDVNGMSMAKLADDRLFAQSKYWATKRTMYYEHVQVYEKLCAQVQIKTLKELPQSIPEFPDIWDSEGFNARKIAQRPLRNLFLLHFFQQEPFLNGTFVTQFGTILKMDFGQMQPIDNGTGTAKLCVIKNEWNRIVAAVMSTVKTRMTWFPCSQG